MKQRRVARAAIAWQAFQTTQVRVGGALCTLT
jgi:hypothetical protein